MTNKPDFLFETSWEVCNKVGGIHTVITSKLPEFYKEFGDNMAFIGPDLVTGPTENPEFTEDKTLFEDWRRIADCEGIRIRVGRWKTIHNPIALLVDFSALVSQKDRIFGKLWEIGQVDSLSGSWDYTEAALFGYAVGRVIESFSNYYYPAQNVVAQFHEWMTGAGILHIEDTAPHIGTIFTTHATVLGRSLAGNGLPLYSMLGTFHPDQKAKELNVSAKHSLEKAAAAVADTFTTVSEVTAKECTYLLDKEPDFITPNGFSTQHLPPMSADTQTAARAKLCEVTRALTGESCDENTIFMAIGGRYEFKNKGIDIFLDTLGKLNETAELKHTVVGFILVPGHQYGPRKDLLAKMAGEHADALELPINTHRLNVNEYDPVLDKCKQLNLLNFQGQQAKIIFAPVYLDGNDGIFNMSYYELLSGFDLSAFPSYYEPWGYTPLESIALGVPTVTTNLAGFGQWMHTFTSGILDGLAVLNRTEDNYWEVVEQLKQTILTLGNAPLSTRKTAAGNAQTLAKKTVWENFKTHYFAAFNKAVGISMTREKMTLAKNLTTHMMESEQFNNDPVWRKMIIHSNLPERLKALEELSMNLWWCWNFDAIELFEEIAPADWERKQKNPIALLNAISSDRLEELEKDKKYLKKLDAVYTRFREYMDTPARTDMPKIAYFSMEYGLSDNLKIFSGGLGILAGDYIKEASDCNIPLIAIGFLYKFGYFTQELTVSGEQQANQVAQKFSELPIIPVFDDLKRPLTVELNLPGRIVKARIWKVCVGRVDLYLLDTDYGENSEEDKTITHQLYGGDWENRLKQEMFLGIGGIRAIHKMKLEPEIYHCNEGHAALINVERLSNLVQHENLTFFNALEVVRSTSLFTTHTPVPAGHDEFSEDLIRTYLRHLPDRLKIDWDNFLNLGRGNRMPGEKFSMSVLAANTSQEMNGVSKLHGFVSRDMFNYMWKGYAAHELHIDYVTNGVHYYTWTAKAWQDLYKKEFGEEFLSDMSNKDYWAKIFDVDDKVIWDIRNDLRKKLIDYIKERFELSYIRRHENPKLIVEIQNAINPNTLTIGFARRFATYKRAHLIFSDIERLSRIVNNPERPVQFLFAGKAHPADGAGQDLIKNIVEISRRPEFVGKILFLENYDMELAKRLVKGVDIWLNNPTRPLEASGTSGQKAEMNGVLNFSVLDGWWVEGYKEKAGWALTEKRTYHNQGFQDELDAATIYSLLENEVVPLYYDRNKQNIPTEWVQYIKRSIAWIAPEFTTKRMLDDYIAKFYLKLADRRKFISENSYENAIAMTNWKAKVIKTWADIEVVAVDFPNTLKNNYKTGENYRGEVTLDLKGIDENDIGVEMVFTLPHSKKTVDTKELMIARKVDSLVFYEVTFELNKPGSIDYGLRIYPKNANLPHRQDFPILRWI